MRYDGRSYIISLQPSTNTTDDFLASPQRPFARGQARRTAAEMAVFGGAMQFMHDVYTYCDCVLHLGAEPPPEDPRLHAVDVRLADGGIEFSEWRGSVQVVALDQEIEQQSGLGPFFIFFCAFVPQLS